MPTRKEYKEALTRFLDNIIEEEVGSLFKKMLQNKGIVTMQDFFTLYEQDIQALMLADNKPAVRLIVAWNIHLVDLNGGLDIDYLKDMTLVTADNFNRFRNSTYPLMSVKGTEKPNAPTQAKTDLQDFQHSIKRDKSHYVSLTNKQNYDDWKRATVATIKSHRCKNVIDATYMPHSLDAKDLFREQQRFIYDVLISILKTPMGRHFVRKYEASHDAQMVWKEYTTYMTSSTSGELKVEQLLSEVTSLRLSSSFKGTTISFITEWLNKIKLYEELTPTSSHFPDSMKKILLQNAVSDFDAFKLVKTAEQLEIAKGNNLLPYDKFTSLLWSVASAHDKQLQPSLVRGTCVINVHQWGDNIEYEFDDHDTYDNFHDDDDETVEPKYSTYQATHGAHAFQHCPSLTRAIWESLSISDQRAWDQLSDGAKSGIICGI